MSGNQPRFIKSLLTQINSGVCLTSEILSLDETRPQKLEVMQNDASMYCRRNGGRLDTVAKLTTARPSYLEAAKRSIRQKLATAAMASASTDSKGINLLMSVPADNDENKSHIVKSANTPSPSYHVSKSNNIKAVTTNPLSSWFETLTLFMKYK